MFYKFPTRLLYRRIINDPHRIDRHIRFLFRLIPSEIDKIHRQCIIFPRIYRLFGFAGMYPGIFQQPDRTVKIIIRPDRIENIIIQQMVSVLIQCIDFIFQIDIVIPGTVHRNRHTQFFQLFQCSHLGRIEKQYFF